MTWSERAAKESAKVMPQVSRAVVRALINAGALEGVAYRTNVKVMHSDDDELGIVVEIARAWPSTIQ